MSYVHQLESGKRTPSDAVETLVRMLQEQMHAGMLKEESAPYRGAADNLDTPSRMIRVIGWAHAGEAASYEEIPGDWQRTVPTECQDPDAFAVQLEGDSMEPKFTDGDVLVVQPNEQPYSGCYVVARFADDGVIFRRMEMSGGKIVLKPLNDGWPATSHMMEEFSWIYPVWGRWTQIWKR